MLAIGGGFGQAVINFNCLDIKDLETQWHGGVGLIRCHKFASFGIAWIQLFKILNAGNAEEEFKLH